MTIETVTCARCGARVPLDVDHGEVRLDTIHMDARDDRDDYILCRECTVELREDWTKPV